MTALFLVACGSGRDPHADSVAIGTVFANVVVADVDGPFKIGGLGKPRASWTDAIASVLDKRNDSIAKVVLTPISLRVVRDTAHVRANWSGCDSTRQGLTAWGAESDYKFVRDGANWRHVVTEVLKQWDGWCDAPRLKYRPPAG